MYAEETYGLELTLSLLGALLLRSVAFLLCPVIMSAVPLAPDEGPGASDEKWGELLCSVTHGFCSDSKEYEL